MFKVDERHTAGGTHEGLEPKARSLAFGSFWMVPVALAWTLLAAAELLGVSEHADRHVPVGAHVPSFASTAGFLITFALMLVAMMLPANVPVLRALTRSTTTPSGRYRPAACAFLAGYATIWMTFGATYFTLATVVVYLAAPWQGPHDNGWVILGGTLALAGAYQASSTKLRYLEECRREDLWARGLSDNRASANALKRGLRHGWRELFCCGPLMLVMFAAGHGLVLMAALTCVMIGERAVTPGRLIARTCALVLVIAAALVTLNALPLWTGGETHHSH